MTHSNLHEIHMTHSTKDQPLMFSPSQDECQEIDFTVGLSIVLHTMVQSEKRSWFGLRRELIETRHAKSMHLFLRIPCRWFRERVDIDAAIRAAAVDCIEHERNSMIVTLPELASNSQFLASLVHDWLTDHVGRVGSNSLMYSWIEPDLFNAVKSGELRVVAQCDPCEETTATRPTVGSPILAITLVAETMSAHLVPEALRALAETCAAEDHRRNADLADLWRTVRKRPSARPVAALNVRDWLFAKEQMQENYERGMALSLIHI